MRHADAASAIHAAPARRAPEKDELPRMDDPRKPRAVSGEIMTEAVTDGGAPGTGADVIDAEYEVIAPREAARTAAPEAASRQAAPLVAGLQTLRPGAGQPAVRRGQRAGALFWVTGAVLVFTAFWISGGHALVKDLPFLTAGREAVAIRIASLKSSIRSEGDRALLFVDGDAVNEGGEEHAVPTLSINVLDGRGNTTHYLLGTNGARLVPGQHFAFSSRLIAPNAGVKSVSVSFKEQQD